MEPKQTNGREISIKLHVFMLGPVLQQLGDALATLDHIW
jgi:hypothetical protein